jgi:hypothetical protein
MIKIIKDIVPFGRIGFEIKEGAEIHFDISIQTVFTVSYKDGDGILTVPFFFKEHGILLNDFLDEICRLNTGHNSYFEYNDYSNQINFK